MIESFLPTTRSLLLVVISFLPFGAHPAVTKLDVLGITGTDNRVMEDSRGYPWSAIGRLNITTGGFCTATVIAPRRVLTAAHCLWNRRTGRWFPPCALHFLAAYRRGEYAVHALVSEIQVAPAYEPTRRVPDGDWAVLTLDRDVSASTGVVPLYGANRPVPDRWIQAGYSRDRRHVLTVDPSCRRTGRSADGRVVSHDCDATFGDSGSPLLVRVGDVLQLVAVHVAVRGRGERASGIAVSYRAFKDWIEENPPTRPPGGVKACWHQRLPDPGRESSLALLPARPGARAGRRAHVMRAS